MTRKTDRTMGLTCPRCGKSLLIHEKFLKCTDTGCGWFLWRTIAGRFISDEDLKTILDGGQTGMIDGFISREGKPFSTMLRLDGDGRVEFVFRHKRNRGGRGLRLSKKW